MDHQPPPAQTTFHLDGAPGSTTAARHHAEGFLERLRPPLPQVLVQDAVLAVSELVSNAVRHAPGPCALDLLRQDHRLVIAVTDTSPEPPVLREPDLAGGNGGFGMNLLNRVAEETTVRTHRDGKTVTITLSTAFS
ncbi:ATP-binding protein [Streptacidiphilus sp. PAMC 29251]